MTVRMRFFLFVFFPIILLPFHLFSQAVSEDKKLDSKQALYYYNLKYHYGFVMNHSYNMAHLANQRVHGIEFEFASRTSERQSWAKAYKYPIIGISSYYFFLDPNKPLGNMLGFTFFAQKTLLETNRSQLGIRLGIGPGISFRRFDLHDNYKNNLISSVFSFCFNTGIQYRYFLSNKTFVSAGISLVHFSNGSVKVPNLGINLPALTVGFGLREPCNLKSSKSTVPEEAEFIQSRRKLMVIPSLAFAIKESLPANGKKYFAGTFSLTLDRILNKKSRLAFTNDIFYDASSITYISKKGFEDKRSNYFKMGFAAGHILMASHLDIVTQFGFYYYDPIKNHNRTYQRIGLAYWFNKKIFAGVYLKTHFGNADFVEWKAGVAL